MPSDSWPPARRAGNMAPEDVFEYRRLILARIAFLELDDTDPQ
jgi:hypothetical protein